MGAVQKALPECQDKECQCEETFVRVSQAIGLLAVLAAAIVTRKARADAAQREYEALLERLRIRRQVEGLPRGVIETVEQAAAVNAAFSLDLVEMDRQIAAAVAELLAAKAAAEPKPITIEVIGGGSSGK